MKFKRSRVTPIDASTNVINLIDVLLLLLIFFMLTTTFARKTELSITLPEAASGAPEQPPRMLEVSISADGAYAVNGVSLRNDELDTLTGALKREADGDTTVPLRIVADGRTPHQAVVRAMDAAGQAGFTRLAIATRPRAAD